MSSDTQFEPNFRSRFISSLASNRYAAWLFARILPPLDVPLLRWTNGRTSLTSFITALPIISLTTIGAKSGLPRTSPLIALQEGNRFVLIASNFGQYKNPAWYYNLKANPEAQVSVNGQQHTCASYEAEAQEREKYWHQAVSIYAGYAVYKKRASHRKIPIMVLDIKEN